MNDRIHTPEGDDEDSLRDLLREAGAREMPPANVVNDVRQAVFEEWQQLVRQRRRVRFVRYGLAASVIVAIVAVLLLLQPMRMLPGQPVATVARVEGTLQMATDGRDAWQAVLPGTTVSSGAMLRADEGTRAALDFAGLSVRLDGGSLIELKDNDRVALDAGALYVDADPAPAVNAQNFVVETLYGSVRHVGTQYAVRTLSGGIAVSVREGRVEIQRDGQQYTGTAGEHIVVSRRGELQREAISPQDSRWQWASSIAPVFAIERRPLAEFLDWASRETGKHVSYASPEVQARAEQLILRGSVSGLPPEQALAAVLATTPFKHVQKDDSIRIEL